VNWQAMQELVDSGYPSHSAALDPTNASAEAPAAGAGEPGNLPPGQGVGDPSAPAPIAEGDREGRASPESAAQLDCRRWRRVVQEWLEGDLKADWLKGRVAAVPMAASRLGQAPAGEALRRQYCTACA
jgi:hypothetical protein